MNKQSSLVLFCVIFLQGCSGAIPELGVTNDQFRPCPDKPNCVNSQATDKAHFIPSIQFNGTPQDVQARLLEILTAWGRAKVTVVKQDYIRAAFTSNIFRFVDDVEFYFPSTKNDKTIIHFRSASRLGHSDLGVNRTRMEEITKKLKDEK